MESIGLAEYIERVKQDLLDEQFVKGGETPLFAVDEIEIELSVVATKEGSGSGKIGFKLGVPLTGEFSAEGGGGGKYGQEDTQTIRVKLQPLLNKEQILAQMSAEQLAAVQKQGLRHLARTGDDDVSGSDRA